MLRSGDKGNTRTLLPDARPKGWFAEGFDRMDEGRPLNLGGARVLFISRTPQGHLFTAWSSDDGKTWNQPAPSTLAQPDAPPMLFPLSDGRTLVTFHHNKVLRTGNGDLDDKAENMKVRSEIWGSISTDEGHTWSEPRFVFANATESNLKVGGFNHQCSYLVMFIDDGALRIFLPHRWQQVLHLSLKESALVTPPPMAQLAKLVSAMPAPKTENTSPAAKAPVYAAQLASKMQPRRPVVCKKIGDRELSLDLFEPSNFKATDKPACFVAMHGGGWTSGSSRLMYAFDDYREMLGMMAISVQCRLYKAGTDVEGRTHRPRNWESIRKGSSRTARPQVDISPLRRRWASSDASSSAKKLQRAGALQDAAAPPRRRIRVPSGIKASPNHAGSPPRLPEHDRPRGAFAKCG